MNNKIISTKKPNAIFLAVILLIAGVIVMSSPFVAYGEEPYQSFKCNGNNVNIDNIEQIQQRQTENNNNNFDATANSQQQQLTPTEAEGEEPLNALTGNSNGNGNGEPLLTLKNVCLNFGINENSGLITQDDDDGNGDGPTTCEECFEKKLSSKSLKDLLGYLSGVGWGLTEFCDALADQEGGGAIELAVTLTLQVVQISDSEIQNVIECLKKIGFIPPPPPPVDTEPPNVLSFTAEPFRVSFSSGGTITITAHVTDATGVQRVGVFIQDECGGSPGFFQSFELPRVAGTLRDGTYQSTFTFPESALDVNHFCNPNLAFQIGGVVTDTLGNGKGLPLIGVILEP